MASPSGAATAAPVTSSATPASATVLEQGEIPGSAAATATAAPAAAGSRPTTPSGHMKYGESMGYALPATKDRDTALEVRVTDLAATKGEPSGSFELSIANRTGSPFDLSGMRIRAVDSSGATLTEVAKTPANAAAFGSLDSPQVVVAPFTAPADVQDMEIWVQPSPTATDVTSWSATGE